MKLRNTILTAAFALSLSAWAIPAKHGVVRMLAQPDGTAVNLQLVGDEHCHYYLTSDNKVVMSEDGTYYYATLNEDQSLTLSDMLVHNPQERTAQEAAFVETLDTERIRRAYSSRTAEGMSRANSQDGKGSISTAFPTTGTVKSLVFLVEYSDVPFVTENAGEYFTRLLNEEGFSENSAVGSARDYYVAASLGKFIPEFDVYGPVTLPNNRAYYGKNNSMGQDMRPQEMLLHAGQILDETVDFSEYDLDNDGFVDNVYVFYAGRGEADGAGDDTVWPHQSSVGYNSRYRFDKVQLNRYACGAELSGNKPDGIGTFCHEFGHVLGLPDLYNTQDMSVNYTPLDWSVMDQGCYNRSGNQPPTLSAYERNALKWMGDDLVEITGPASCTLEHIETSNKAYLINTDNDNEYFLIENRQKKNWDYSLPNHGMLIWHIDYNRNVFNNNKVNNDKNHQRVDLIEANGTTSTSLVTMRKYPFGPASKVTEFVYGGSPSFETWSGLDLGLPITDITEADGIITFNVAGGGEDPAAGIADVTVEKAVDCRVDGRTIEVKADCHIMITDLTGRVYANGHTQVSATVASAGLYIVSTPAGSRKLMIK